MAGSAFAFSGQSVATFPIKTRATSYSATIADYTILVDASQNNVTITLPSATSLPGQIIYVKKIDNSQNTANIATTSSQTIDGSSATRSIFTQWNSLTFQNDGTAWFII